MSRRAHPERIYEARRAATFTRLHSFEHLDELDAEHWIAAWERHAEDLGIERLPAAFWEDGHAWITLQRAKSRGRN